MKIKVKCIWCKKIFIRHESDTKKSINHFCNHKCSGLWWSKNKTGKKHPAYKNGKNKVKCCFCYKPVYLYRWGIINFKNHFCSRKCFGKWNSLRQIGDKNPNYTNGQSRLPYPLGFNEKLKEFIRKRDGEKCMNCLSPQKELIKSLDVHHIDYNKDNIDTINLISLCPRCNTKSNGSRKYWQNHYENIQIERKVHLLDMKLEMEETIE